MNSRIKEILEHRIDEYKAEIILLDEIIEQADHLIRPQLLLKTNALRDKEEIEAKIASIWHDIDVYVTE